MAALGGEALGLRNELDARVDPPLVAVDAGLALGDPCAKEHHRDHTEHPEPTSQATHRTPPRSSDLHDSSGPKGLGHRDRPKFPTIVTGLKKAAEVWVRSAPSLPCVGATTAFPAGGGLHAGDRIPRVSFCLCGGFV